MSLKVEITVNCINEYDDTGIYSCKAVCSKKGITLSDSEVDDHTKAMVSDALYMTSTLLKNQITTDVSDEETAVVHEIVEKKWRPYTFKEFRDKFPIGEPIKFREKGDEVCSTQFILIGYQERLLNNKKIAHVYIGYCQLTLEELFESYEWYDDDAKEFKPFRVEE